ncbi:hypothetical protein WG954_07515 [Lacibacter sp. H375]|uniref:hypothetical protein n=1 Tax=Lacibacter sp. H375 TaxID=3133424 RepID=UPI0030C3FD04
MDKRIVLVSSVQPTANPRLVKEAVLLRASGYAVTVVYCPMSPWADKFDTELFAKHPGIKWVRAGYHPIKQKGLYQWARLRRKLYHLIFFVAGNRFDAAVRSFAFYSQELTHATVSQKADLYIGHNLGALPSVVKAAHANAAKAAFDFEDFHRGEGLTNSMHWKKVKATEDKYIPSLIHATTASPLITETYRKIYTTIHFSTINNCFPRSYGKEQVPDLPVKPLKLFWFSQFVGPNRGLETVIAAIGRTNNPYIILSLLGNCNEERKQYLLRHAKESGLAIEQIQFLTAVREDEIVKIAAQHHIGLAAEVPHILNREICLTNKLFMYLLAGNAVIFSNTQAQSSLLATYPEIGSIYEQGDIDGLASVLENYVSDEALLQKQRLASLQLGKEKLNWDIESKFLIQHVRNCLADNTSQPS